jgi:ribosomal-protein-alanine N-acetyltransferase
MNKLIFQPFPKLSTERLLLRQLVMEDDKEIMLLRSDEQVLKYLIISKCNSVEEARLFIEKINTGISNNESIYWGICLREDSKLIGSFCIWQISEENSRAEIGYALHPRFQGKGIMSEAMDAVLNYGFNAMRLHSLEANVDPANAASIKLLEKKGFLKEAHLKENVFFNGRFIDSAIYSLINPGD